MQADVGSIRPLDSVDDPLFPQVMELGDSRRDHVGFLPKAAFEAYAEDSTILVMEHLGQAVGYACYALPGLRVRLIHLCVRPGFEGKGIARALVEKISSRHGDRQGISVKCRPYPGIGEMWRRSRLEQVLHGDPDELHKRFSYLGVLGIDDVREVAAPREVQALRFADTELFPRPVTLDTYRRISGHSAETFICARRVSASVFAALYRQAYKFPQTRHTR